MGRPGSNNFSKNHRTVGNRTFAIELSGHPHGWEGVCANPGNTRKRAAQCLRLAQSMSDPTNKALLLEMAQTWVRLAEQAREAWATPPRWAILSDIRVSSDQ